MAGARRDNPCDRSASSSALLDVRMSTARQMLVWSTGSVGGQIRREANWFYVRLHCLPGDLLGGEGVGGCKQSKSGAHAYQSSAYQA
jgi:hypothetical protein